MAYGFNDDRSKYDLGENLYTKDEIDEMMGEGNLATGVDLKDYYRHGTTGNYYTFPSDGYVNLQADSNDRIVVYVHGADSLDVVMQASADINTSVMIFVKKNMRITIVQPFTVASGLVMFYALS